ncbi:MAG: TetR family transcriptional regulator [Gemmatimonadota bacterium]
MTDPRTDTRARLLEATTRVYAQHGYAGATTRQIAKAAGVNEVTLFRQFHSKDALIDEALRAYAARELMTALPDVPSDPAAEVTAWCESELARLRRSGELVRQCFAAAGEHPEHLRDFSAGLTDAAGLLREYVGRLVQHGFCDRSSHADAAVAMLLSVLISDAVARDMMPRVYPQREATAPAAYASAFLTACGVPQR